MRAQIGAGCLRRVLGGLAVAALAMLMVACSMPRPTMPPSGVTRPSTAPETAPDTTPSRPPATSGRPPIADRAITLNGRCVQTEEDGFHEDATLQMRDNEVQALSWQLRVGRKGSCRFEQADFRQTQRRPHAELIARDGSGCKLMVWQDQRRVTLAHANCERHCTAGIYDDAWPVMFDPQSGACAKGER
jgi:hypothetical protein